MIVKSSASIRPEWVARWRLPGRSWVTLLPADVDGVHMDHDWDTERFELELLPGFGPDGPIATCAEWCGLPYSDDRVPIGGPFLTKPSFLTDQPAYCTQVCLDRAQAKVAVPAEPTRVLATGWVDAFAMVETTDRARCAGATKLVCLSVPRWQKITTPPSGYWYCDYHADVRGAFAVTDDTGGPWADDRIHSARPDAATFSKVAALPPKPIDTSRTLAHMVPRWATPRYSRR